MKLGPAQPRVPSPATEPALPATESDAFVTDPADDRALLRLVGAVAAALIALAATGSLLA